MNTSLTKKEALADLIRRGVVRKGQLIVMQHYGEERTAVIQENGSVRLDDGSMHNSSSGAARRVCGSEVNGFRVWHIDDIDGPTLDELRSDPNHYCPECGQRLV
jgi:hypothetical protein